MQRRNWKFASALSVGVLAISVAGAQGQRGAGANVTLPVLDALDVDGNGELSTMEIADATDRLKILDIDLDGRLSEEELGGPGLFPGWLRLQTTIRVIDRDGDYVISEVELAAAESQLMRLDHDHDWVLSESELFDDRLNPPGAAGLTRGFVANALGGLLIDSEVDTPILAGADNRALEAYMLYTESGIAADVQVSKGTYLLNPGGDIVHEWPTNRYSPEGASSYLLENGLLLRQVAPDDWIMMEHFPVGSHGIVELVNWDDDVVWEYERCTLDKHCLHHDLEPLPNGNILVLSYEALTRPEVEALGRTRRNNEGSLRWFEKILELKPNLDDGTTDIVWQWDSLDHLIQGSDPGRPNYGVVANNPGRIDVNFVNNPERQFHLNSIHYNEDLDQILLSVNTYGEIWIIDHSTTTEEAASANGGRSGRGGRLLYRWGNPAAYGAGTADDRVLQGQHDARWLSDDLPRTGDIMIHNNSAGVVPGGTVRGAFNLGTRYSSVVEVKLPATDAGNYPRELGSAFDGEVTWEYDQEPLGSWQAPFMSGANRLPNGNTLVVNSYVKRIFEITADGERVLDYEVPGPGRLFRVYKYSPGYSGLRELQ
jgi:hypothetical protein